MGLCVKKNFSVRLGEKFYKHNVNIGSLELQLLHELQIEKHINNNHYGV